MEDRRFINKTDFLIIGFILAAALSFAVFRMSSDKSGVICTIVADGVEHNIALHEDGQFSLDGMPNIIFEIKDNGIAFIHSNCPDKVCVNTGFIRAPGELASCLPNKVLIKLVSSSASFDSPDLIAK